MDQCHQPPPCISTAWQTSRCPAPAAKDAEMSFEKRNSECLEQHIFGALLFVQKLPKAVRMGIDKGGKKWRMRATRCPGPAATDAETSFQEILNVSDWESSSFVRC